MTPEALQLIIETLDHVPSGPVRPKLQVLMDLALSTLDPDMLDETVTPLPENLDREFIVLGYEDGHPLVGHRPEGWTDEMSAAVERQRNASLLPYTDAELKEIADRLRPLFDKAIAPPVNRSAWAEFIAAFRAECPLLEG